MTRKAALSVELPLKLLLERYIPDNFSFDDLSTAMPCITDVPSADGFSGQRGFSGMWTT